MLPRVTHLATILNGDARCELKRLASVIAGHRGTFSSIKDATIIMEVKDAVALRSNVSLRSGKGRCGRSVDPGPNPRTYH